MAILGQGVVLMVAGMGIVYLFLWVLIVISEKSSKFVSKFDFLLPDEAPRKAKKAVAASQSGSGVSPLQGGSGVSPLQGGSGVSPLQEGTKVTAPVPGTVLRISAANGSHVSKGEELLVMDVMKMETPFTAPCDGVVTICVAATDRVATGDTLAVVG